MPEINPLSNEQIFLKKIAENTGSDYNTGDVSEINPITIDQILLKEIAANTAGQSGDITELENKVTANAEAIEAMVNEYGAKNLLPNTATSQTVGGVTFTVNADGSVTANGTATELVLFLIDRYSLVAGNTYVLSGCPSGGSDTSYVLQYRKDDGTELLDTGEGVTYKSDNGQTNSLCRIIIQNGVTVSNVTFYPMIRDARITDDTYVSYAMTNRELTEKATWHYIGYGSDDGGEVSCSLNYSEFIFTMIAEGSHILQTIIIPVDQTGHQIYIMAYQSNTYNAQTRIAYDYSNSKFTFQREFLNGWNNIRIDVYAR